MHMCSLTMKTRATDGDYKKKIGCIRTKNSSVESVGVSF